MRPKGAGTGRAPPSLSTERPSPSPWKKHPRLPTPFLLWGRHLLPIFWRRWSPHSRRARLLLRRRPLRLLLRVSRHRLLHRRRHHLRLWMTGSRGRPRPGKSPPRKRGPPSTNGIPVRRVLLKMQKWNLLKMEAICGGLCGRLEWHVAQCPAGKVARSV